jgi:hypothetical protein
MKCASAESFFDRMYREGDRFDRPDIVAHIRQCDRCGSAYKQWCSIAGKLEGAPALDAPPALYGRVMGAIEVQQHTGAFTWLFPLQWKALSYGASFAAVLLIAALSFFIATPRTIDQHAPIISSTSPNAPAEVMAHFEISLDDARQVAVVGDFNGWETDKNLLTKTGDNTWKIDLPIAKGSYQYLFLVDGARWKNDPARKMRVPDGFGGFNTVVEL